MNLNDLMSKCIFDEKMYIKILEEEAEKMYKRIEERVISENVIQLKNDEELK